MRLSPILLAVLGVALTAGAGVAAPDPPIETLQDGVVLEVGLPRGVASWTARVDVPDAALSLGIVLSADRRADLHLRYGEPMDVAEGREPHLTSATPGPTEVIYVGRDDAAVPLQTGSWFLTVENPEPDSHAVVFDVVVFVDRPGRAATLLPGRPQHLTVPPRGGDVTIRTYVPRQASGAVIGLEGIDGVHFALEGPGGLSKAGPADERIFLPRESAPSGRYVLTLASPMHDADPRTVAARVMLHFSSGVTLPESPAPELEPGASRVFVLGGRDHVRAHRVRIPVPAAGRGVVLTARGDDLDVDLFVTRSEALDVGPENAEWMAATNGPDETLVIGGRLPFPAGTLHALVALRDGEPGGEVEIAVEPLSPAPGGVATWGPGEAPLLADDTWTVGEVDTDRAAISWYAFDVPADTRRFGVQLLDASAPVELVVARRSDGSVMTRALSPLVNERIEVTFPTPLPEARRFLIGVLNTAPWEERITFRIAAAIGRPPTLPPELAWPPRLEIQSPSMSERVAAAAVEVTIGDCSGGSGVCVSPGGLVLTCRHCLLGDQVGPAPQRRDIIVAFPRTLDAPPDQAFYARVVAEDEEQDIVLLEPERDVFGRPLPADLSLPWVPLGNSDEVHLGDPLFVIGYPQVGSACSRTPVVVSRGVAAGRERSPGRPAWLKTDAWLAPGHSGGAVVDGEGRLVALAAATLGTTESLGLTLPIQELRPEWLDRIRRAVR